MVIPGLIIVFVGMIGGYLMGHGSLLALVQPAEFVTIGGIAFGTMVISAPMKILKRSFGKMLGSIKGGHLNSKAYSELLICMFRLFSLARKNGLLALEPHISEPTKSDIISKYHTVLHNKVALEMLTETLRMIVDGSIQPEQIEPLMDSSIETFEAEGHMPINVLRAVADGLPGIGIIGAVLGIIITMAHIDGPPKEIGEHVAAALVGTFLGVFGAYGVINPIVAVLGQEEAEETSYLSVLKKGLSAYFTGSSPAVAVEFARRTIFSFDRPSGAEIEKECKKVG